MEDREIVELYWQRSADAITASKEKYGGYCFAVAENILHSPEDSEECVNDTYLGAWNAIPPHRPTALRMFLAKLTRAISFNRYRRRTARKRGGGETEIVLGELAECIAEESSVEDTVIAGELRETVRRFVRDLPEREGNLFVRRYFFTEPVGVIARRYGLTENHVSVILRRTREKLRKQLIKEGYFHGQT